MSTVFHPQTNGQTERMNQPLEQYFKLFAGDNKHKWVELLPTAQMAINKSYNEKLKQFPHEVLYGPILKTVDIGPTANQTASTFATKVKNNWAAIGTRITKTRQKIKKKIYKKKPCHDQTRGQNTFIDKNLTNDKLDTLYIGAFKIINVKNTTVDLFLPDTKIFPKFHASLIKKSSTRYTINYNMELFDKKRIGNKRNITKKTRGTKKKSGKMEELRRFRNNMGTENSFDKRSNNPQIIPKSDIKRKMLRTQF